MYTNKSYTIRISMDLVDFGMFTEMAKKYNRIKAVLEAKKLTQADLADLLDVRYLTVNNYCNNRRQPSIEKLFEIAKVLKVNVKDLINS
jgi:putative transcriptional regulator